MNLFISHASCSDGFCAAWIAHKLYPTAEYVFCHYGDSPPDVIGKDVIIADFSFKREILLDMKTKAKSLIVLDHHKSAQVDLEGLDFCLFDMNKSGGRLTWEHFYNKDKSPWIVDYTEDRDLWRFNLPYSKEVNVALRSYPMTFESWDTLNSGESLISEGTAILRYKEALIKSHIKHAKEVDIGGYKVLCCNCSTGDLISEIGEILAKDRPFGATYYYNDKGDQIYSLRSSPNGVDVSEVAKIFLGGGHKHAAGFTKKIL